jgi:hypothetical protein
METFSKFARENYTCAGEMCAREEKHTRALKMHARVKNSRRRKTRERVKKARASEKRRRA